MHESVIILIILVLILYLFDIDIINSLITIILTTCILILNINSNDNQETNVKVILGGLDKLMDHHKLYKEFKPIGELKELLESDKMPSLSHLTKNAEKTKEFSRILDLNKTIPYKSRHGILKRQLHWGQLKLFLTEVEFLTLISKMDNNNKPIYFVYAGAAPGHHIYYLQKLFPNVNFELYDPNNFVVKDNDKLKTHVQFFTDKDAEYWKSRTDVFLIFCTDIRSEPATSENVIRNMKMQLEWWKIMNPELSMFKFRLPWEEGFTEYPDGDIYIQPFPGATSTETRLIAKKDAKLVKYDNTKYESACYYHNTINRERYYNNPLGDLSLETDGIDNCYDCTSMIHILTEYLKLNDKFNKEELKKLINDVQKQITFGKHNIRSQTKQYFNEVMDKFKRMQYVPCGNNRCKTCTSGLKNLNPLAKGFSKATIVNEDSNLMKLNVS
jgi:hypothetical protein